MARRPSTCLTDCALFFLALVYSLDFVSGWTDRTNSVQELTCAQLAQRIRGDKTRLRSSGPKTLDLGGQWVSEKCEIRPGPEFLLRKYTFFPSGRFQLYQFYYSDSSCHEPAFCLEARGRFLKSSFRRSWTVQGGTEAEFEISNVAVVTYTAEVARAMQQTVNKTCRTSGHHHTSRQQRHRSHWKTGDNRHASKRWQPWERYDLFTAADENEPPAASHFSPLSSMEGLPHDRGQAPSSSSKGGGRLRSPQSGTTKKPKKTDVAADRTENDVEPIEADADPRAVWNDLLRGHLSLETDGRAVATRVDSPVEIDDEDDDDDGRVGRRDSVLDDVLDANYAGDDCSAVHLERSFNELQLIRAETRSTATSGGAVSGEGNSVRRLYLGDVHTDSEKRASYRPRSYQDPLVFDNGRETILKCRTCRAVSESSNYYPPSLPVASQQLAPIDQLLAGSSWTSDRCETRPYGVFLTRRLTFKGIVGEPLYHHYRHHHHHHRQQPQQHQLTNRIIVAGRSSRDSGRKRFAEKSPMTSIWSSSTNSWEERLQYFADPSCRVPYYSVYGQGRYTIGNRSAAFGQGVIAYEADFEVTQLKLTVNDRRLLPVVQNCGGRSPIDSSADDVDIDQQSEDNTNKTGNGGSGTWVIGVERDVTASGGCRELDIELPTSGIPQLLAAVRRGPNDVVLLIGQHPMTTDINDVTVSWSTTADGQREERQTVSNAIRRRPTSFYPGLRRCTDDSRVAGVEVTGHEQDGSKGAANWSAASRRTWRRVATVSSGAASDTVFRGLSLVGVIVSAIKLLPTASLS